MQKASLFLAVFLPLILCGATLRAQEVPFIDDEYAYSISSELFEAMDLLDLARDLCAQTDDGSSAECSNYHQMRFILSEKVKQEFTVLIPEDDTP